MSEIEKIISLGAEIKGLRDQREQLDKKIVQREKELNSLVSPAQTPIVQTPVHVPEYKDRELPEAKQSKSLAKGEFKPGSVADYVFKKIQSQPGHIFEISDFVDEDAGRPRSGVVNALFRMTQNNQIVKVDRGKYRNK